MLRFLWSMERGDLPEEPQLQLFRLPGQSVLIEPLVLSHDLTVPFQRSSHVIDFFNNVAAVIFRLDNLTV